MEHPGDAFEGLMGSGRRFRVNDPQCLGLRVTVHFRLDLPDAEDFAPFLVQPVHGHAVAFHQVDHPLAKETVDTDDRLIAGLEQIGHNALHPAHAGGGNGKGQLILRPEELAQHAACFVKDLDEPGIEVANGRSCHRASHPVRHGAGPGTHENSFGNRHMLKET